MKRTKRNTSLTMLLATIMLSAVGLVLFACTSDDPSTSSPTPDSEIRLNADVWRMMEGTRATFYDDAQLRSEGFICTAYNAGTTTKYIIPVQVNWDGGSSQWVWSNGKHYWPASGNLDFFAYSLHETLAYISGLTYTTARIPQFTCNDLPTTLSPTDATKEFVWALTTDQNKAGQGVSGVAMTFQHPFARVKFKLSAASGTNVTVNRITIPYVFCDGTYTYGTGWLSWVDNDQDLIISGAPATNDDAVYLVIPKNYGTKTLTVNATWSDWGTATKDISANVDFNWEAGFSYTYTLTLSKEALIVDVNKYTEQW